MSRPKANGFPWTTCGYIAWHAEAENRMKRGERQKWCTGCERWRWRDETCCGGKRITEAEHEALQPAPV